MDVKKAKIENKILDVVSYEKYTSNLEVYANTNTAIEVELNGEEYILPYRNPTDDRPGVYPVGNTINFIKKPKEGQVEYTTENIIDFSNVNNMSDMISKQSQLRNIETEILTSPDDIFIPRIGENDSPEMVCLKTAVIKKHIDIDKYAPRFGPNHANDKRIFKDSSTTLFKMLRICNNLDIEVELTLRDKSPDVPNPIGEEVSVILTGNGGND